MRDDYKMKTATQKVSVEVEQEVAKLLASMEKYSKISQSELANTALKRFISQHKDFLPPEDRK
ncbi:MAG: hypothetical protein JNL01_10990 [Bdellovibrionales bacterium]|nr:hypothetical protein [Bdellovibrionales bacterium]